MIEKENINMDEVIKELEDLFATKAKGNVVYFNDVTNNTPIPNPVVDAVKIIAEEHPDVIVKIGRYSVKVIDKESKEPINSSKVSNIHDKFIMGEMPRDCVKKALLDEGYDENKIEGIVAKWDKEVIKSSKVFSSKSAIECFPVSGEEAQDIDELRETFPDKGDLRAVLEDYFHIYDDYADMSAQDFDRCFEEYTAQPIESAFFAGDEVIIEIKDGDRWEFVSLDNTPEGWSTKKNAKVFPSEERARSSTLLKRLNEAGYSEDKGNLRISKR